MKIHITPERYSNMLTELCSKIVPVRDKIEWIIGIERGGVHISSWLAYSLNKTHDTIRIQFRGDEMIALPHSQYTGPKKFAFDAPFLLVDDIVDSGKTVKKFIETTSWINTSFWIASLHWCQENSPNLEPDFYVEKKLATDWIVYPWEPQ